jgi:nucleoside-diphosphate-sugar epimerase
MPPTVLLTGVSGFLGGALGRHLRSHGWHVTGISRRAPRAESVDHFVPGDLAVMPLEPLPHFDAIVHCAALAAPWGPRHRFERANITATERLLRLPTPHFIFISSSSVHYEFGDQLDLTEHHPLPPKPINEYARTKRLAEDLVRATSKPHTIVRPRAIFGPEDTVLFPRILRAARTGSLPRIVREDGNNALGDLIYIDNLVHYLQLILDQRVTGTYNLTNAEPVPTYNFLQSIFADLSLPPIRRSIPIAHAFRFARALELASGLTGNHWEPPITQFGVEVMARSKTFDVRKMVADLGPPPISLEIGRRRFVGWQKQQ